MVEDYKISSLTWVAKVESSPSHPPVQEANLSSIPPTGNKRYVTHWQFMAPLDHQLFPHLVAVRSPLISDRLEVVSHSESNNSPIEYFVHIGAKAARKQGAMH